MKIYLPLKDDLLDHGDANSTWYAPYGTLPTIKSFGSASGVEFLSNNWLSIKNLQLITGLTVWTLQCWFYPYTDGSDGTSGQRNIITNYPLGQSSGSTNINIILYSQRICVNGINAVNNVTINTWHQVYVTSDGTNIDIYIDNDPKQTISRGSYGFSQGLTIGNDNGNFGWDVGFRGGIAQFCLTDKYNDGRLGLFDKIIYLGENKEVYGMV